MKETDPEKADLVREANRKRKAAERARKKATKENIDPVDSESSDVSVNKSIQNCDFSHESRKNRIGNEEPNVNVNVNESVLNNAFMEVDVEERTSNSRRNRIMTRAEIQEELEADVSDYDDDDE